MGLDFIFKSRARIISAAAFVFIFFIGGGMGAWYYFTQPILVIGETEIARDEYRDFVQLYSDVFEYTGNEDLIANADAETLKILIERIGVQEFARERGLSVDEEELERRYRAIVDEYEDEEEYEKAIQAVYGWTPELTKETIRVAMLREKIERKYFATRSGRYINIQAGLVGGVDEDASEEEVEEVRSEVYALAHEAAIEMKDRVEENGFTDTYEYYEETQQALVGEFKWSMYEAGVSRVDLDHVFNTEKGDTTTLVEAEDDGYFVIYKIDDVGEGEFDSWGDFAEQYSSEGGVNINTALAFYLNTKNIASSFNIENLKNHNNGVNHCLPEEKENRILSVIRGILGNSADAICSGCRGARVEGRIIDSSTGVGIVGADVVTETTYTGGGFWCGPRSGSETSSSNGTYVFQRVDGSGCFANCGWGTPSTHTGGNLYPWTLNASASGYNSNSTTYWPGNGFTSDLGNLYLTPSYTPVSVDLNTNPSTINEGEDAAISWTIEGDASSCGWMGDNIPSGLPSSPGTSSGSTNVSPSPGTYSFGLECTGDDGSYDSDTTALVVNADPPPQNLNPTNTFNEDTSCSVPVRHNARHIFSWDEPGHVSYDGVYRYIFELNGYSEDEIGGTSTGPFTVGALGSPLSYANTYNWRVTYEERETYTAYEQCSAWGWGGLTLECLNWEPVTYCDNSNMGCNSYEEIKWHGPYNWSNGETFTTIPSAYPVPDFYWNPEEPLERETTVFSSEESETISGVLHSFTWTMDSSVDNEDYAKSSTTGEVVEMRFFEPREFPIMLTLTNDDIANWSDDGVEQSSANGSCSIEKIIDTAANPEFREVPPGE